MLSIPGVTPSPRPKEPEGSHTTSEDWILYNTRSAEWDKNYEIWKHITCPCGLGYFDIDGLWRSGADVRNQKYPRNPLWSKNDGVAPKLSKDVKFRAKLHERDPEM